MPKDAIITIKKAEAEARAIEADARARAQEMIEETEQSCVKFCQKEKEELCAELEAQLDTLRQRSEALLQRSAQADEACAEQIREGTKVRQRLQAL